MTDDRSKAERDDPEDITEENGLDRYDDAVIAADATGMLAGEKFITDSEIEGGLESGDDEP